MRKPGPKTLVVNFFGGPSSGKSTTATGVFSLLKQAGINSEYVSEFAKDLVWQDCRHLMGNQIWIFGTQHERLTRHLKKVDVIVTDAPLLHSIIYNYQSGTLSKLVAEEHAKLNNLNFFLKRTKPFQQAGRVHDEEQSRAIDTQIHDLLDDFAGDQGYIEVPGNSASYAGIVDEILGRLGSVSQA